jgi:hypothetical protein
MKAGVCNVSPGFMASLYCAGLQCGSFSIPMSPENGDPDKQEQHMMVPENYYRIYQPRYKTPCVFDLHERGLFRARPFVTQDYAYRVIAGDDLSVKLQLLCLKEKSVNDPATGERYNFFIENTLIDLDGALNLKPADLSAHTANQRMLDEIQTAHEEWRNAYIPVKGKNKIEQKELNKKLLNAIAERKEIIRKELVRKNSAWVNTAMPRMLQDFLYGLYRQVDDHLYDHYKQMGGTEDEKELVKKITLFQRIYDCDKQDLMRKPDGGTWKSEDEIWECWIGFAGSEDEAKKVCRTLESVFLPFIRETA